MLCPNKRHLKLYRNPRSNFGNKLLKNTKEIKHGVVKIYCDGSREKTIETISCSIIK